MEKEEIIEQKKEKIKKYLKNPHNLIFILIVAFAIILRLYYFSLTKTQPMWWDEAEYMNMARAFAFGLDYPFLAVRPILFPLIIALFLKITTTEFLPRLFILVCSIASVIATYLFGKEIYNRKIGLLASFFMSIFYLNLFFSYRILVDVPSLAFFTFSAFLFYKYLKTKSNKALYLGAAIIAIGTLLKLSTAVFLFAILIYLLITEKLSFLKKKEIWIAGLIFLLILAPYIIWGYFQFNGFVITMAGAHNAPENYFTNIFANLKSYFSLFPTYFSWPLLIFFILGIFSMYRIVLGLDILLKGKDPRLKRSLYLFLMFLIPILTVSFSIAFYEDRYIFNAFPAAFIISGIFIIKTYNFIKKKKRLLAIILLIILLGSIMFIQLRSAGSLIKNKQVSYLEVKQAGLWLKENSDTSDIIATRGHPLVEYYSERETIVIPDTKQEFESALSSNPNIKFFLVSMYERHPEWSYSYPQEKNLTAVQAYIDPNQQPILIIYKI